MDGTKLLRIGREVMLDKSHQAGPRRSDVSKQAVG